jgi:hypothetical protein
MSREHRILPQSVRRGPADYLKAIAVQLADIQQYRVELVG